MREEILTTPFKSVIKGICSRPVNFSESESNGKFELTVVPNLNDYRILIGTGGRQVKAFQYLFKLAAKNLGIDGEIEFEESFGDDTREEPKKRSKLNHATLKTLVGEIASIALGCPVEIKLEPRLEKLEVKIFPEQDINDALHVCSACNSIFYPYGRAHGEKVDVLYGKAR